MSDDRQSEWCCERHGRLPYSRIKETPSTYGGWLLRLPDGRRAWLYDDGSHEVEDALGVGEER